MRHRHHRQPDRHRRVPADAVDQVADDEDEPVHADDVSADDREDVAVVVAVADGDVAGEVHHRRPSPRSSRRRPRARSARPGGGGSRAAAPAAPAAAPPCANAFDSSFGSGRTPSETSSPASAKSDEPSHGHGELVRRQRAVGEERPEDERAEDRARDGAEEHERHAARAALGREHLGRGGAREQHDRLRGAAEREPEEDELARVDQQPSAVISAARRCRATKPAADHRHPADPVRDAARRGRRRARPAIRKTAGPSPRMPFDRR